MDRRDRSDGSLALNDVALMWPTPAARDYKGANGPDHLENGSGRLHLDQLPNFVEHVWSTPRATDGEKGGPNQSFGAGGTPLPAQPAQWMTPRVERGGYTRDNGDPDKQRPTLEGQASSHPDHLSYEVGGVSSHPRRSLNPLFVEWLMGWPPGWTLLAWTDLGCSETALSLWRRRMRSELFALGLPREAPPAQLGLFG